MNNFKDPYCYPGTDVLINKLGIKDAEILKERESALVAVRSLELIDHPIKGDFDLKHYQAIHKHLFQDVYEWAGKIRDVEISKSVPELGIDSQFWNYANIQKEFDKQTQQLNKENHLKNLSPDDFAKRLAHYFGNTNEIHPMREGNGRAQREFFSQLANEANYSIDWNNISARAMRLASIESMYGKTERMQKMFSANVTDKEQDKVREILSRQHGEHSIEFAQPNREYTGEIVTQTDRYIVQKVRAVEMAENRPKDERFVLHAKEKVIGNAEEKTLLTIKYPAGQIGLVKNPQEIERQTPDKQRGRDRER